MATIAFSNGQKVNFDGTPTQADVEEVATKLGIHAPIPAPQQSFVQKNVINPVVDQFKSGIDQIKKGFSGVTGGQSSALQGGEAGLGIESGIASTVTAPLAPILKPIQNGVDAVVNGYTGKNGGHVGGISDIPILQKFAQSKVGTAAVRPLQDLANAGNVAGTIAGFAKSPEVAANTAPKIADLAEQAKKMATDKTVNTVNKFKPTFEENVTKAFPTLKKDVGNMSQKITNVRTAFTDIAQNKDSLGLTDKNGNPRTPNNFVETVDAQNKRLPQIYKDYSSKLSEVDKPKFDENIQEGIKGQVKNIDDKLVKENSVDNRRALLKIKNELHTLRDTSPEGIQSYIQSINQKVKPLAPGGSLTAEQIQYANLGGELRKVLDSSVEKIDGSGYQELRNVYAAHKSIQSQLLMAAKKEINNIPGFTEKLGNAGLSIEGVNFLMSHNPTSLITGLGLKAASKYMTWLRSPQRGLQSAFKKVDIR